MVITCISIIISTVLWSLLSLCFVYEAWSLVIPLSLFSDWWSSRIAWLFSMLQTCAPCLKLCQDKARAKCWYTIPIADTLVWQARDALWSYQYQSSVLANETKCWAILVVQGRRMVWKEWTSTGQGFQRWNWFDHVLINSAPSSGRNVHFESIEFY